MEHVSVLPSLCKVFSASWVLSKIGLVLAAAAFLLFFWKRNADKHGERKVLPPGPRGLPIVGYLPFLGGATHVAFKKLADHYGPIVRLRLGREDVVVLNDLKSVKEGLNKYEVLVRPKNFLIRALGVRGIVTLNGKPWLESRRFAFSALRDLGYGKKTMEELIKNEAAELVDVLLKRNGVPSALEEMLFSSVSKIISALVFGERCTSDRPKKDLLVQAGMQITRNGKFTSRIDFLPTLRRLLFWVPCSRHWILSKCMGKVQNFFREEVDVHLRTSSRDVTRDYFDSYLRKMKDNGGETFNYNMKYLVGIGANLFGAGTTTVTTALQWLLLTCARDPKVQGRIQQDIDAVIGGDRSPEWDDRFKMPFTMAAIWEILRWKTIAPLGIMRAAERDTKIAGFYIPAGTVIFANFWAVHNDPTVWKNPSEFDPSRFLNADGSELLPRPEAFIPFSTGRRKCPGETLAIADIFLYLTTLLQTFTVHPKKGHTISMDVSECLLSLPMLDQELVFLVR